MKKETRTVVYDDELRMEAYRFEGIVQPFPSHFHEHYVIGCVEYGKRTLSLRDREYAIKEGSIVLFNPGDSHACAQSDESVFDYRGLNISKTIMLGLVEEITGKRELPGFAKNVIHDGEAACHLRPLHEMIMKGSGEFKKEEALLFLLTYLIQHYGKPFASCITECSQEIEKACEYMAAHFTERVYLDQICRHAGLSKSTLLRAFTKEQGITPYRYLETIRINAAKMLLSKGVPPVEAAIQTGFADQSHFTNYFNQFIGLTPGTYREIFSNKNEDGGQ